VEEHVTDQAGVEGDDAAGQFQVDAHGAGPGRLEAIERSQAPDTGSSWVNAP
jgi:hypothetical protein